jgi:hypothetical protein
MQPKAVHGLSSLLVPLFRISCAFLVFAPAVVGCNSGAQSATDSAKSEPDGSGGMAGAATDFPDSSGGASQSAGDTSDAAIGQPLDDGGVRPGGDGGFADPPVPPGLVPVVLALGPGGRTAVSCSNGKQFRVNDFHKTPDCGECTYASTGLAGNFGSAIASLGWGGPGHIIHTDNGVDWQELGSAQFSKLNGSIGQPTESASNTFFDGMAFKTFWSHKVWASPEGKTWKETPFEPKNISHIRQVIFAPEARLLVMRVERDENGGRNFLMMTSTDLGQSYKTWSPRTTGCAGFAWGPVSYAHGVILAGGTSGSVCRSQDGGSSWNTVPTLLGVNTMFSDRLAFYATRGDELMRSEDGVTWARVLKASGGLGAGVCSTQTGCVVSANANGQLKFYRSDDGQSWTPSSTVTGSSFSASVMSVAYLKPSPLCPGL